MAINKPTKPDSELPKTWGGTQYPYTEEQIAEGLPEAIPTVIDGGTLNYEKKGVFERLDYVTKVADVVIAELEKIQNKYNEVINSKYLDDILDAGTEKMKEIFKSKYEDMKKKIGLSR